MLELECTAEQAKQANKIVQNVFKAGKQFVLCTKLYHVSYSKFMKGKQ